MARGEHAIFGGRARRGRGVAMIRVHWLARAVPLIPGHPGLMVCGIAWDADKSLRNYWLQLGRAAAAGTSEKEKK
jgi:hypothetical protein